MTGKRNRKINIPPNQKMEHTYSVSFKRYTGNNHMSPKTMNNKVKLLKSKCFKCEYDKSMFLKQIHR